MSNATINHLKLRDVRHYGAAGDGTTNDSAAIQGAINAATGWALTSSMVRVIGLP